MDLLLHYHWPGNLRELHHTVRTVVLFCHTKEVQPEHVVFQPALSAAVGEAEKSPDTGVFSTRGSTVPATTNGDDLSLRAALRRHVRSVYQRTGDNQRQAARLLGISRARLVRHLRAMQTK
jgi:DNA-binding NtrC family response regulator